MSYVDRNGITQGHPVTNGYHDVCPSCGLGMVQRKQKAYNYFCHGCKCKWLIVEGKEPEVVE